MVLMRYAITCGCVALLLSACNALPPELLGDPVAGAALPGANTTFQENVYTGVKTCTSPDTGSPLTGTFVERAVLVIGKDGLPFVRGDQVKSGADIDSTFAGVDTTGEILEVSKVGQGLIVTGTVRLDVDDEGYYGDLREVYTPSKGGAIDYQGEVDLLTVDEDGNVISVTTVCSCMFEAQ